MNKIKYEVSEYLNWTASALLSSLFFTIWIVLQWLLRILISKFPIADTDVIWMKAFQFLFALSTLVPIASYIIKNSILQVITSWRVIKKTIDEN